MARAQTMMAPYRQPMLSRPDKRRSPYRAPDARTDPGRLVHRPLPPTMPAQPPMLQQASYQQPVPAQENPVTQQIDQLIKAMREAPTPSQREWAAQQLINFEWRANPQILYALLQSASQDPAVSVRAGCVYCLGRTQASVEPVLGALNAMRNDTEPRVRQAVEQALVRLGKTSAHPEHLKPASESWWVKTRHCLGFCCRYLHLPANF